MLVVDQICIIFSLLGDHYRSLFGKYAGWAQSVSYWLFFILFLKREIFQKNFSIFFAVKQEYMCYGFMV